MAKGNRRGQGAAEGLRADEGSVSAVIGTVLILAITVIGITGVLFLGGPLIQRLRDQSNLESVSGQLAAVRQATLKLGAAGEQRAPQLSIPDGTLSVVPGDRVMVTVDQAYSTFPNCDFHVTGWTNPSALVLTMTNTNCPATLSAGGGCIAFLSCVDAFIVSAASPTCSGTNHATSAAGLVVTLDQPIGSIKDWCFRLRNPGATTVYAEAWLIHQDALTWHSVSTEGEQTIVLEGGMLFSRTKYGDYMRNSAPLSESAFGSGDFLLRLPVYNTTTLAGGTLYGGTSGRATPTVPLRLASSAIRTDTISGTSATGTRLRFDFHGDHASVWSGALLARNGLNQPPGAYAIDAGLLSCPGATTTLVNHYTCVTYVPTAAPMRVTFVTEDVRVQVQV